MKPCDHLAIFFTCYYNPLIILTFKLSLHADNAKVNQRA